MTKGRHTVPAFVLYLSYWYSVLLVFLFSYLPDKIGLPMQSLSPHLHAEHFA